MTQFSVPWRPRQELRVGPVRRLVIGIALMIARVCTPLLRRHPGVIFFSSLFLACLLVWLIIGTFGYVDANLVAAATAAGAEADPLWGISPTALAVPMKAAGGLEAAVAPVLSYLLWPVQFRIIKDITALGGLFAFFNIVPVYLIWWERKVAGRIQSRPGPMRVGGWHGWAQSFADGIKLVFKEDVVPDRADHFLFRVAPYLAVIPALVAFLALPFGTALVFREMDVSLLFILAMLGIDVVGVIVGGWASNNKWSVYGGMREACQMVSYEIPMGMALLVPVLCVGSLSLQTIGAAQGGGWFDWLAFSNPFAFAACLLYFVASLASCKRAPFDLPESESELVAGFHTEYSGFRWALFFFAEYASMFIIAGLAVLLFFGGWYSPLPMSWAGRLGDGILATGLRGVLFAGPFWFIFKCVLLVYVQIWLRWTLPRIRIDQVLYACIQVLLPLGMLILLGNTLWVWAEGAGNRAFETADGIITIVLASIGLFMLAGFLVIAVYGFTHRRKLVGNLATDLLPGA